MKNISDFGPVRIRGWIDDLIKGERRGGRNEREESSVGRSDELRFDIGVLDPRVEAILFDLDSVIAWREIKLVVGDGGELVVEIDSG